ncbi:MAG TPA: glycosyltransferase family protein [Balneolaceae bacterium]|nr:glycosyltransferase family protein [Balneolaceae bacterium]
MNQLPQVEWHLITPYCSQEQTNGNVLVKPVANRPFIERLSQSRTVITSAGFETCTEAMFLEKKLMVIPIKNQYE